MKYYKITNRKEKHYDMKYKTGLNVDIEEWNPHGDCLPGGIYFTGDDILAFISFPEGGGYWVRSVKIPKGEKIYRNPGEPVKWKAHRVFLGPRKRLNLKTIKKLVEEGADVHSGDDLALRWAATNGHLSVVQFLVRRGANVHADNDSALQAAASNGRLSVVQFLVRRGANIHAGDDGALLLAAQSGELSVVRHLVEKGANIHARCDAALRWAANSGHLDVVQYLAENRANIHANEDSALHWAAQNGHQNVVKYLKRIGRRKKK